MKTYLVTGGAGFIGSTLVDSLLKDNNKVVVIDNFCSFYDKSLKEKNIESASKNSNYKLYSIDIRNRDSLKEVFDNNKIDCVIHLAAMAGVRPSLQNPILYQEVNYIGTGNILEEMKEHNINNLVFASSSSVYGNCKEIPFKEDMIVDNCISVYASTKKAGEVLTYTYHDLYNMNIMVLRFFTVYGPRQRPDLAISKFTKLILEKKEIPMYGDGDTSRDYTYIDDIVGGIKKSINYLENNNNVYEILNLGSSNPISLKEMIETIKNELNIEPKINKLDKQKGDVERTYADITKAKELIGYEPKTSFKEGIEKYVNWYKSTH